MKKAYQIQKPARRHSSQVTITLPTNVMDALKEYAQDTKQPLSAIFREALELAYNLEIPANYGTRPWHRNASQIASHLKKRLHSTHLNAGRLQI